MISWKFVKQFCDQYLELPTFTDNSVHARCPICGDSKKSPIKKRFHLTFRSPSEIIYHCFNCNASGNFYKLYSFIKKIPISDAHKELRSLETVKETLTQKTSAAPTTMAHNHDPVYFDDVLKDCIDEHSYSSSFLIENYRQALRKFRDERKLPKEMPLFFAFRGKYEKRIIIPIFDENNRVIYFQARSLKANPSRKYLNPPSPKNFVPYFHILEDPVIITEGLIDARFLGKHGTAFLGVSKLDDFIDILKTKIKQIIVAFDNDAPGYKLLSKFLEESKHANFVKYFLFPKEYKDINDLNKLKMIDETINIYNFVLENTHSKTKTEILLRLDKWRKKR